METCHSKIKQKYWLATGEQPMHKKASQIMESWMIDTGGFRGKLGSLKNGVRVRGLVFDQAVGQFRFLNLTSGFFY